MLSRYYRELLNFLTRATNDRDTAADLAQESFARVLALQRAGAEVSEPRALLYRTARNLVVDAHRRQRVRQRPAAPEAPPDPDDDRFEAGPAAWQPDVALSSAQGVAAMVSTIDRLPLRCREAFILHKFDGLPQAEVARRMGISVTMVERHLKHAMAACRACLHALDGQDPE